MDLAREFATAIKQKLDASSVDTSLIHALVKLSDDDGFTFALESRWRPWNYSVRRADAVAALNDAKDYLTENCRVTFLPQRHELSLEFKSDRFGPLK